MRRTALALVMLLAVAACEGAIGLIRISLTTAPNSTVMDDVQTARMTLSNPFTVVESERDGNGNLFLALEAKARGPDATIDFEGFDSNGDLVAFGRSGPLAIAAIDVDIVIYVGAPETLTEAPSRLDPPRSEIATSRLSFGLLMAGGRAADGTPTDNLDIYNVYTHQLQQGADLPERRASLTAMTASFGLVFMFGGFDADGAEQAQLWLFDTNVAPAGAYTNLPSDDSLARAGAVAAPIGNEQFLITGDPLAVVDGQSGRAGVLSDGPALEGTATSVLFADKVHTLITGDGAGPTSATLFSNDLFAQLDDAPPELDRTGHDAVIMPDGRILIVGGETAGGITPTAVIYSVTTQNFELLDTLLATPRRDAAVAITLTHLVVAGGIDASGAILTDAEVFDAFSLEPIATLPMLVPRTDALAEPLANGQILIAGGLDAAGEPTGVIELFNPAPLNLN